MDRASKRQTGDHQANCLANFGADAQSKQLRLPTSLRDPHVLARSNSAKYEPRYANVCSILYTVHRIASPTPYVRVRMLALGAADSADSAILGHWELLYCLENCHDRSSPGIPIPSPFSHAPRNTAVELSRSPVSGMDMDS